MHFFSYEGELINKTPHEITILGDNNEVVEIIPASNGQEWRLDETTTIKGRINGKRISKTVYRCSQLPEPQEGVWYIVSALFKLHYPERTDLLVPTEVVRDGSRILGCKSLGV